MEDKDEMEDKDDMEDKEAIEISPPFEAGAEQEEDLSKRAAKQRAADRRELEQQVMEEQPVVTRQTYLFSATLMPMFQHVSSLKSPRSALFLPRPSVS